MCSRSLLYDHAKYHDQDRKFFSISKFLVRLLCHSLAMCLFAQEGPSGQRKWTCLFFSPFINFLVLSSFGWLFGWPGSWPVQSELTTSSKAGGITTGRLTVSCSVTFTSNVDAVFWWIMRAVTVHCWQSCPEGLIQVPSQWDLRTLKRNRKIHDEVDLFSFGRSQQTLNSALGRRGAVWSHFRLNQGDRMWVGQSKLHVRMRFDRRFVLSPSSASLPEVFRVFPQF